MRKELSPGATAAIIVVALLLVVAVGWFYMNREPEPSPVGSQTAAPATVPESTPSGQAGAAAPGSPAGPL